MHLYLAGPMTGRPSLNFPTFTIVTAGLRNAGYTVTSPHEITLERFPDFDPAHPFAVSPSLYADLLGEDLAMLTSGEIDGLALLPGWENSKGALAEFFVAQALGLRSRPASVWRAEAYTNGRSPGQ